MKPKQKLMPLLFVCGLVSFLTHSAVAQNKALDPNTVCNWGPPAYSWAADFNGDGTADIASAHGTNVFMHLSTGRAFSNQTWTVPGHWGAAGYTWVADFNGDGKADIASAIGGNIHIYLSTSYEFEHKIWTVPPEWGSPEYSFVGDFNGDGTADIASAHGTNVFMHLSTGSAFSNQTWTVPGHWGTADYTWVDDFNGDGKADIASAQGASVYMYLSTGNGFQSSTWPVKGIWGVSNYTWVADLNGDGKADIATAHHWKGGGMNDPGIPPEVHMHLSTGSAFQSHTTLLPHVAHSPIDWLHPGNYNWAADFNGDGKDDIISVYPGAAVPNFILKDSAFLHLSRGSSFQSNTVTVFNIQPSHIKRHEGGDFFKDADNWGARGHTWAADFNADGSTDMATARNCIMYMHLSPKPTGGSLSSGDSLTALFSRVQGFKSSIWYLHPDNFANDIDGNHQD